MDRFDALDSIVFGVEIDDHDRQVNNGHLPGNPSCGGPARPAYPTGSTSKHCGRILLSRCYRRKVSASQRTEPMIWRWLQNRHRHRWYKRCEIRVYSICTYASRRRPPLLSTTRRRWCPRCRSGQICPRINCAMEASKLNRFQA